MVVLGLNFSRVCTGFLEETLGSHDTPGPKLHTTVSKIITTFTYLQQSEALQHTWRSYTYTYKHSFDHMLAHMSILIIGS